MDLSSLSLSMARQAPVPMATVDGPNHIVCYVNAFFCHLLGKPKDELVGRPFRELVPKNDKALTLLDRVYRTGMPASHTEEVHSPTHPLFWSYLMWPVTADEQPLGVIIQVTETAQFHETTLALNEALVLGSVRQHELAAAAAESNELLQAEISERKEAEEALRVAQEQLTNRAGHLEGLVAERTAELTATNKQLEAFIYSIAHDLRAPLRAMQGYSTILLETSGTGLNETDRDFASRINKSAQFMDAMLIDLLAFSSVSQQRIVLTSVNLETVVASVLARLQMDIAEKSAHVESSDLWPWVWGHEMTVIQVLFNLVSNALKFVTQGVTPVIRLRSEVRGEFIRVWVEDNGPGIASEHQDQIFRLFHRLDGAKFGGTGIGLAIVQKGVERMGGEVGVESSPGQGSRFWFELRHAR